MIVEASTSSSSTSTTGAEEGSEPRIEPKSARGQRGATGKAGGASRDWVRGPLCALPIVYAGTNSHAGAV